MAGTSETFKNQSGISPFSWAGFLEAVDSLLFYSLSLSLPLSYRPAVAGSRLQLVIGYLYKKKHKAILLTSHHTSTYSYVQAPLICHTPICFDRIFLRGYYRRDLRKIDTIFLFLLLLLQNAALLSLRLLGTHGVFSFFSFLYHGNFLAFLYNCVASVTDSGVVGFVFLIFYNDYSASHHLWKYMVLPA